MCGLRRKRGGFLFAVDTIYPRALHQLGLTLRMKPSAPVDMRLEQAP